MKKLYAVMSESRFNKKKDLIDYLTANQKKILYTFGLSYRNPTIYKEEITLEQAIDNINKYYCDVTELDEYIYINCFSANDLY